MSKDKKSNYYDAGEIETIDVIKAKLTSEQYTGYLLGNAIKYACRLNFKGCSARDAEKMANYSKWVSDQKFIGGSCACSECDRDYIANISKHYG